MLEMVFVIFLPGTTRTFNACHVDATGASHVITERADESFLALPLFPHAAASSLLDLLHGKKSWLQMLALHP